MVTNEVFGGKIAADGIFSRQTAADKIITTRTHRPYAKKSIGTDSSSIGRLTCVKKA